MGDNSINANQWGLAVCKSLGLDPSRVTRIVIDVEPHTPAMVHVTTLDILSDITAPIPHKDICNITFSDES